jgi:hypothetical protein
MTGMKLKELPRQPIFKNGRNSLNSWLTWGGGDYVADMIDNQHSCVVMLAQVYEAGTQPKMLLLLQIVLLRIRDV